MSILKRFVYTFTANIPRPADGYFFLSPIEMLYSYPSRLFDPAQKRMAARIKGLTVYREHHRSADPETRLWTSIENLFVARLVQTDGRRESFSLMTVIRCLKIWPSLLEKFGGSPATVTPMFALTLWVELWWRAPQCQSNYTSPVVYRLFCFRVPRL
jgi:hypothetical protein